MIKTNEYYEDILGTYDVDYENDDYTFTISYKTDKASIPDVFPDGSGRIRFFVLPKREELPNIYISVIPKGERPYCTVYRVFERSYLFEELNHAEGVWALAGKTVVEVNEIVEKVFPGYYVTDKKTW